MKTELPEESTADAKNEVNPLEMLVSVPELRNKLTLITNLIALIENRNVCITGIEEEVMTLFYEELENAKNNIKELVH